MVWKERERAYIDEIRETDKVEKDRNQEREEENEEKN